MYGISIYGAKSELVGDYDLDYYLDNGDIEEIYYLENDNVYIILRLLNIWCNDLDVDGRKLITLEHFFKTKVNFKENKNVIQEYVEAQDIIYRTEQMQEFFNYVGSYITENEIKYLYIETDYFS